MGENIDVMVAMLRKLDSPREKDCLKFVKENGGFKLKTCMEQDDLLATLLRKYPDVSDFRRWRRAPGRDHRLPRTRKT